MGRAEAAGARPARAQRAGAGGTGAVTAGSPVSRNEVLLVGRVSGAPQERELPSGDQLVTWRVVLDRPPSRRPAHEGARAVTVDTVDCVAWAGVVRRTARSLDDGDLVSVQGALRRRFWRGSGGVGSRTEVEVLALRRLRRAG